MNTRSGSALSSRQPGRLSRRGFLSGTAAASTVAILDPRLVRGSQANSKIEVAMFGCGNRGRWIADLFTRHGGYQVVATYDYFADRAARCGEEHKVPAERRFSGLEGYKRLLADRPDAVAVESPPYFHPQQVVAAVEAGCHVYLAKPIAVDVPGCLAVEAAGKAATAKDLCLLVDFQTRADKLYQEAVRRVLAGDIGPVVSGEAVYYCGPTWSDSAELDADPTNQELRLRNWGIDRILSGDIITEQNIHALDVACWLIDKNPVGAVGTCGRKARKGAGTCNDHFGVLFNFPDDVLIAFASKQYGIGYNDIGCRMFGPQGTVDTHYFGDVKILGHKPYRGGKVVGLYTNGAAQNVATFHDCISQGKFDNPTVPQSVRSNLTTILGRTAAYRRQPVTWDEMIETKEKLEADLSGLKA